ncbi:SDR family NAD(P)-dependent oxidoreductase [bacterium]|nr:SDR family NAD(P)-dependent oxidoreductase [bacterium]
MTQSVVITGGNRGIGLEISKCFLTAGYTVVVGARSSQGIEHLDTKQVHFHAMDVRDENAHMALAEKALGLTGQLNAWVNNAGISAWRPIEKIDQEFFDELVDTNLKGAFWGCKAAAYHMANRGGSIINISSIAGKRGSAKNAMYCATKFGMNGLSQSLAKELGSKGIRVNALCPVLIKTDGLMDALMSAHSPANGNPEEFLDNFRKANSATGKLPSGQDVGDMAVYLASPKNHAITGQCINIDCGVFPQ